MKMDNLTGAIQRAVNEEVSLHPRIAAQILRKLQTIGNFEEYSPGTLTEPEAAVLEMKSKGFSNRKISDELHISEDMVNRLLSNILNKLQLMGQTQAVVSDSHPD